MALRATAMNHADSFPRIKKPRHLSRKLALLFLLTAAYALCLVMLLLRISWFPLVLYSIFADGALAIVTGFGVRLLLSQRGWFIRSIAAVVMPIAGLAIMGYFSDWEIGIDVVALSLGYVSWADLIHLVVGVTASWAALWAWHRPSRRKEVVPSAVDEPEWSAGDMQPRRSRSVRNRSLQPGLSIAPQAGVQSENGSRLPVRARPKLLTRQPVRSRQRKRLQFHRPHVQLALVEEHRCPYCLEPVYRTDPRGVKECEVCHTLHHADCWAITGTCQVPHLNS